MAIDVGSAASNRASSYADETWLDRNNLANADGTIDHLETYTGAGDVVFGTLSGSSSPFTIRDYTGALTASAGFNSWDAPGDFTALDIVTNDGLGIYTEGALDYNSGGATLYYAASDQITGGGSATLGSSGSYTASAYGTGVEAGSGFQSAWARNANTIIG